jgi:hypothetical protein
MSLTRVLKMKTIRSLALLCAILLPAPAFAALCGITQGVTCVAGLVTIDVTSGITAQTMMTV